MFTQVIPDAKARTLKSIVKQKVEQGTTVYSDGWAGYDGLVFDGYEHHRINHSKAFSDDRRNHIYGIESFWSFAKNKLQKRYGIKREHFHLHQKEMEFRFNNRGEDLAELCWRIFLNYSSNNPKVLV